jgi:putative AlgH/UPF0301 family transcriptional regulator
MKHELNVSDRAFRAAFEECDLSPSDFDHRGHVRLAYVYLAEHDDESAAHLVRKALVDFLRYHGIDPSKYHETMTRAWLLAVRHFMESGGPTSSSAGFIEANPELLDSRIMLSHYSADLLFSERARTEFVEPDLDGIPRHGP